MTQTDDVLEGYRIHVQAGDGMQRVEPAAGLVNSLTNKVSRELLFKLFLVLEGCVPLGIRHGAGIKPHVNQFRNAGHFTLAFRAWKMHMIDMRAVQIQFAHILAGIF